VSRAPLLALAAAACVVAPVMALADLHSPVRVAATLAMFTLAPGAALLPLLAPRRAPLELGLVVGASLAICALTAQAMLWLGAWAPDAATCVLAGVCLALMAPQLMGALRSRPWPSR
jgi:hypothetical protein